MDVKRITVRVSPELHAQVFRAAAQERVSLNTFVTRVLELYVQQQNGEGRRFPLRELGALLAPAAASSNLTEEELMRHVREVRERIWEERYRAATEAAKSGAS